MKCHYEVLEISRDAEASVIKTAYRKLALKWHPDKNLDNPDLAKEQFQLVQQAYEILSDKQERAWYDAHRDQILLQSNSEFQDKSLDVFQYFTTTCFKGYEDDECGFYAVYRNIFERIAKEDIEFIDEKEEFIEIPGFGNSTSSYEEVVCTFYDYWMSYTTKKSYSWLDPFDIREGKGDRRAMKIIERENKKHRQKVRKERHEEVRGLVAFVRKRDRRVLTYRKEMVEKVIENRKKQEILSQQKRLERTQQHANEKQADWMKFDNVQSGLEEIQKHLAEEFGEDESNSDEDSQEINNLYCIACNKVFRNPKAFENHESSKKHKENVEILRQTLLAEEAELTDDSEDYKDNKEVDSDLEEAINHDHVESEDESLDNEENLVELGKDVSVRDCEASDSEGEIKVKPKKKTKKKKNVQNLRPASDHDEEQLHLAKISDDDFDFGTSKSQKKKNNKKMNANKSKTTAESMENSQIKIEEQPATSGKKPSKKDRKKSRKDISTDIAEIDTSHCCVTCKGDFSSKNKLFDHLKKTGHGVPLPTSQKQNKKSNSKRENM